MPLDSLDPVLVHHIVNSLGWSDLRPLQKAAIEPLTDGGDALLLAPTAGGKTEAAIFPLLSRMTGQRWQGTSVLYLCPLKALLNNLEPRLERYAGWLGRRAAVWHGDVRGSARRNVLTERPDILLTTPESLESMLVSVNVDHRTFFAGLQAVVVDEVHAFAGDDRGWHLLAVLERLTNLVGRPLQRVGLSATVGNPGQLLEWLQGSNAGRRSAAVVAPDLAAASALPATASPPPGDIELDYVGTLANAATVIASLHAGQKRLVFCESRQTVEELGQLLRERGLTTFLSHASLSADERRRSEQAFADARDCVIVSTSTLELGIDVGDLDRVIQINTPSTVASFLQRLGRTGRRPGSTRNCLLLAVDSGSLVKAAALLLLWGRHWVEPVAAPPEPRHIVAQQILALCLQQHRIGDQSWQQSWNGLAPFGPGAAPIVRYLVDNDYLDCDDGMLFIGPAAELRFGRRNFMDMTAVFTGPPEFSVLTGRTELGRIDPSLLTEEVKGERRLLLGGRSWTVTFIDWRRRRCFVEPADGGGRARWMNLGLAGQSFELTRAMRDVLLGADPPVRLTRRAVDRLKVARDEQSSVVHPGGNVIVRDRQGDDVRWWTWAGYRTNATLAATLGDIVDPAQRFDDRQVRLREDLTPEMWRTGIADAADRICLPEVNEKALVGLKFSDALPKRLAIATLAARLASTEGAKSVLAEHHRYVVKHVS
ncbi:DEAD/DEAH box helicase [Catellatospora aurea]|uniref:DEAD/DEAH box helicase n=1 Tax=Catellatospora aurea TaxID=1337874 RepID=A0ABW2H3W7_9ACTN